MNKIVSLLLCNYRNCLLLFFFFSFFTGAAFASVGVSVEPNSSGVISTARNVNIVIRLSSDAEIDPGKIQVTLNGEDISSDLKTLAVANFNEKKTVVVFYYPVSASYFHEGEYTFEGTTGAAWDKAVLNVRDYGESAICVNCDNPTRGVTDTTLAQALEAETRAVKKDVSNPVINFVTVSKPAIKEGESLKISFQVSNAAGGSGLKNVVLMRDGKAQYSPLIKDKRKVDGSYNTLQSLPAGTYSYSVKAESATGNSTISAPVKVVISEGSAKITSIVGNSGIVGQPDRAPSTATNRTKGFYAVDYYPDKNVNLQIIGKGFGSKQGKGTVTFSDSGILLSKVVSWSDSKIIITPKTTNHNYTFNENVTITVNTDTGEKCNANNVRLVGTIATRPNGQCTWYVAKTRLNNNLGIPLPSAFSVTRAIDSSYEPHLFDAIVFGDNAHVGIISSSPILTYELKSDGRIAIYTFELRDMNANWKESEGSASLEFRVHQNSQNKPDKIVSNFERAGKAKGFFR